MIKWRGVGVITQYYDIRKDSYIEVYAYSVFLPECMSRPIYIKLYKTILWIRRKGSVYLSANHICNYNDNYNLKVDYVSD